MTVLTDKIVSFSPEYYVSLNQAYAASPTNLGTDTGTVSWSLTNEAPIALPTGSSPDGEIAWQWGIGGGGDTSATRFQATSAIISNIKQLENGANLPDTYSVGVWFKITQQLAALTQNNPATVILEDFCAGGGLSMTLLGGASSNTAKGKLGYSFLGTASGGTQFGAANSTNRVDDGQWHYLNVNVNRVSNLSINYEFFLDGVSFGGRTGVTLSSTSSIFRNTIGSTTGSANMGSATMHISHFYLKSGMLTSTQIAEIYQVTQSTNATINDIPGTATSLQVDPAISTTREVSFEDMAGIATNAHLPEPTISTEIGTSVGSEPLIASGEISYLAVFGNVNYEHTFAIANCILTEPVLSFTFNDNTEVVTSHLAGPAEFINPFSVIAQTNISVASDTMTASADIGTHNITAGVSISYPANESIASAEQLEPSFYGSPDKLIIADPMLASNAVFQGDVYIQPNYFNFVKRNNPIYYVRDFSGANTVLLNEGSLNFGTLDKGASGSTSWSLTQQPSGDPLVYLHNGTSLSARQPYSNNSNRWRYTDKTFWTNTLASMYNSRAFSVEFWYKPRNTSTTAANNSSLNYVDNCFNFTLTHTTTNTILTSGISSATDLGGGSINTRTTSFSLSNSSSLLPNGTWAHIVLRYEPISTNQIRLTLFINNLLAAVQTVSWSALHNLTDFITYLNSGSSDIAWTLNADGNSVEYTQFDEVAIYPIALTNNEIQTHYNFVVTNSPNTTFYAETFNADGIMQDGNVVAVSNKNIQETPAAGSSLFVNPLVVAVKNITINSDLLLSNAIFQEPSFYGTPDYRQDAVPMIASMESGQNSFALDGTYFAYVQTNIAPFRYVSFDNPANPLFDYGTDNDYSVAPTAIGGSLTGAAFGINNFSVKSSGSNASTDGIIMLESEWNDAWGTNTDHHHSSFWIQRAASDTNSIGLRVLWNLNSYFDNQHAVLYYYQDKLHLQIKDATTTLAFESTNTLPVFNYLRHHIVLVFNHTGINHTIKVYLDGALVIDAATNEHQVLTINGTTATGPNDPAYNRARLSAGSLITPFIQTFLPQMPQPYQAYIDELHFAQTPLNQTQITNLYNAMPQKTNIEFIPDFMLGQNATLIMPTISTGNTQNTTTVTALAEMVEPIIYREFNLNINMNTMYASADSGNHSVYADNITNINIAADTMFGSAFMTTMQVLISIPAQVMTAAADFAATDPYFDPYHILILLQSRMPSETAYGGRWSVGDIDSNG